MKDLEYHITIDARMSQRRKDAASVWGCLKLTPDPQKPTIKPHSSILHPKLRTTDKQTLIDQLETFCFYIHPVATFQYATLLALRESLIRFQHHPNTKIIYLRNHHIYNGMTKWRHKWELRNWIATNDDPIAYKYLWKEIIKLSDNQSVVWSALPHKDNPVSEHIYKLAEDHLIHEGGSFRTRSRSGLQPKFS